GLVASADAALDRPVWRDRPDQIGARAEMAAEGIVPVVAGAEGEGEIIAQEPLVLGKQRPGGLFEILGGKAIGHLGIPPLATDGEDMIADRGDELGIEDVVGGFERARVADN